MGVVKKPIDFFDHFEQSYFKFMYDSSSQNTTNIRVSSMTAYQQLEQLFSQLSDLHDLQALAHWDEATMMPVGGGMSRARALSTLSAVIHQKLTDAQISNLINEAQSDNNLDAWQQRNLELMQRKFTQATCLPVKLVTEISEKSALCEQAWREHRAQNNWQEFEPKLEQLFQLIRESAHIRSNSEQLSPYDILLDEYSPGVTQAMIDPIFNQLKTELPPLIDKIIEKQKSITITEPQGPFDIKKQRLLGLEVMKHIGFDFHHGRLDTSHHPFCGGTSDDVRMTTRYNTEEFLSSLLAICHETGHACYEQGLPKQWHGQPIGLALGMSVHESQSLIIEMPVCRSFEFMQYLTPHVINIFGKQAAFTADNLFHIATRVKKSLIRVNADEVTYPLHVILRYEIERDLFNGKLTINDLPDAWHDKMQSYFGLSTKGNDKDGAMQDVHWPSGGFGYFPAYTLGRLIAAQCYQTAVKAHPDIPQQIQQGNFNSLMEWLRTNIHSQGSRYTMDALVKQATKESLNSQYFIDHIKKVYL